MSASCNVFLNNIESPHHLGYWTVGEVHNKDQWIADRSPLLHEEEVARLCNDPLNETLTPAHIDTILQHVVLFHKRPLLLLSALSSVQFANNLQSRGVHPGMTRADWKQQVSAAVPPLTEDRLFGDMAHFEVLIVPIYVPGHFVSIKLSLLYVYLFPGTWHLRHKLEASSLLRQPAQPQ